MISCSWRTIAMSLLKVYLWFVCCRMANFEALDFKGSGVSQSKNESGLSEYAGSLFDPTLTWKDIDWLKSLTKLPIIIKGILSGKVLKRGQTNLTWGHITPCMNCTNICSQKSFRLNSVNIKRIHTALTLQQARDVTVCVFCSVSRWFVRLNCFFFA